jgi:hypothetical protein
MYEQVNLWQHEAQERERVVKHSEHKAHFLDKHVKWEQLSKAAISRFRF